jgi:ferredoxin-nitrite reductase
MLNYESLTSGKSGESPALCRNCKGTVRVPSQNADEGGAQKPPSIFYSLRRTEKESLLLSELIAPTAVTCPGLFSPTSAQDGILSRIRVPGGILNGTQCEVIATLSDQYGNGLVQVTNRANLQLRGLETKLPIDALGQLQAVALAAPIPALDGIRNIMSSPTVGIDPQALVDTRPLVREWNRTLMSRPDFAVLSPKFSVCFDGGEGVGVGDRPNDITLIATKIEGDIQFRLHLSTGERGDAPQDVGVNVREGQEIALLTALAEVYRNYILDQSNLRKPPRLRALLKDWGVDRYLQTVSQHIDFPLKTETENCHRLNPIPYAHLGIHPQQQADLSYAGVSLPLGQLRTQQLRALANLSRQYGDGSLRLTPWQTVIVPNVLTAQVTQVQQQIEGVGLQIDATHPSSAMVACSGTSGCSAAVADTQRHAQVLMAHLGRSLALDRPINIHFSGCDKSCAQHQAGDITLVGVPVENGEAYQVYVGSEGSKFGRLLDSLCSPEMLPQRIEAMIRAYQQHRVGVPESFGAFVGRFAIGELRRLFDMAFVDCRHNTSLK